MAPSAGPDPAIGSAGHPLITVQELASLLPGPDQRTETGRPIVVADVRWVLGEPDAGRAAYLAGHIPGAIFLDLDADLADLDGFGAPGRHPLPSPGTFARMLERRGVGDDTLVVGYDDVGGWVAARLWWMLDNLGHTARGRGGAVILDGGWHAWQAAGLAVSTGDGNDQAARDRDGLAHLTTRPEWSDVISRDELRSRLGGVTLLDARAGPRYRGETEPIDPVAGHVPTAISAPWDRTIAPDGRFRSARDLREGFAELGIEAHGGAAKPVVTSCGSGVSAIQHVVAARIAGLPDPILYVGSYSDWSRSGLPVATGSEPGDPGLARGGPDR